MKTALFLGVLLALSSSSLFPMKYFGYGGGGGRLSLEKEQQLKDEEKRTKELFEPYKNNQAALKTLWMLLNHCAWMHDLIHIGFLNEFIEKGICFINDFPMVPAYHYIISFSYHSFLTEHLHYDTESREFILTI